MKELMLDSWKVTGKDEAAFKKIILAQTKARRIIKVQMNMIDFVSRIDGDPNDPSSWGYVSPKSMLKKKELKDGKKRYVISSLNSFTNPENELGRERIEQNILLVIGGEVYDVSSAAIPSLADITGIPLIWLTNQKGFERAFLLASIFKQDRTIQLLIQNDEDSKKVLGFYKSIADVSQEALLRIKEECGIPLVLNKYEVTIEKTMMCYDIIKDRSDELSYGLMIIRSIYDGGIHAYKTLRIKDQISIIDECGVSQKSCSKDCIDTLISVIKEMLNKRSKDVKDLESLKEVIVKDADAALLNVYRKSGLIAMFAKRREIILRENVLSRLKKEGHSAYELYIMTIEELSAWQEELPKTAVKGIMYCLTQMRNKKYWEGF